MDLESYFPYQLASVAEAFSQKLVDVYQRRYGLSREEWRLLLLLADARNLTSLELSHRTTLDRVQVSRAAKKLDEKGLIRRSVWSSDKRLKVYTCTDKGLELFSEMFPKVEQRANTILNAMTARDRNNLVSGLAALTTAMDTLADQTNCKSYDFI